MKLGTLLSDFAKKTGIDTNTEEFKGLLAVDLEVPDAIAGTMQKGLMNLEAAKVHPDVRKLVRTEALNGVDAKVLELLEEMGIEDSKDIVDSKNSYEKIALLTRKVKDIEAKKAGSGSGKEKDAYEKQLSDLNAQMKVLKEDIGKKEQEFEATRDADLTNFELQKLLLPKNYALPEEMGIDLKLTTAQAAIKNALTAKGFNIVRDKETGGLKLVNKEGLPAYSETNDALDPAQFIDGALAQNKLLKVNDQSSQQGGGNTSGSHTPAGGQTPAAFGGALSQIEAQIAAQTQA